MRKIFLAILFISSLSHSQWVRGTVSQANQVYLFRGTDSLVIGNYIWNGSKLDTSHTQADVRKDYVNRFTVRQYMPSLAVDTIAVKSLTKLYVASRTNIAGLYPLSIARNATSDTSVGGYVLRAYIGGVSSNSAMNFPTAYVGFNTDHDLTYFRTYSDGANNGGGVIYGEMSGRIRFAPIVSTGATNQILTAANIASAVQLSLSSSGVNALNNTLVDSALTVMNGGRFYRVNSTYDTAYSPLTSITHNAPIINKSLALTHDYYSFIGVSQDAVLGLFSQDEGGHGSTIDLGEVNSTTGAIVNKWSIGRGSTTGGASGLYVSYGTNKDYTLNTTRIFADTNGGFYTNRNASVTNGLLGIYSKGGQQRIIQDTSGRVTLSNQTTSGDWVLSLDTYDASQASVILGRVAAGTQTSPTQTGSGRATLFLSGRGYTNSGAFATANTAVIRFLTTEAVTSSTQGTGMDFATTPKGSTSRVVQFTLDWTSGNKSRWTLGTTPGTGLTGQFYMPDSGYIIGTQIWDALRNLLNIGTISSGAISSTAKVSADSSFTINERSTTPTSPTSNTQMHYYMKGDKIVWQINAAGTLRWYYFDATAVANQNIIYSATAP